MRPQDTLLGGLGLVIGGYAVLDCFSKGKELNAPEVEDLSGKEIYTLSGLISGVAVGIGIGNLISEIGSGE